MIPGLTSRRAIFEAFEPPSSDEEDVDDDDDDDDGDEENGQSEDDSQGETDAENDLVRGTARMGVSEAGQEDINVNQGDSDDEDEGGTGVMTSQLRHFVIQVSDIFPSTCQSDLEIGIYAKTHAVRYRSSSQLGPLPFHRRVQGGLLIHPVSMVCEAH
jgi:hypothetical protein